MTPVVDLVALGPGVPVDWALGAVMTIGTTGPARLAAAVRDHLACHRPDALLFWDTRLGPAPAGAADLLGQPDDVWHAGLALGTGGQPSAIDLVAPTWMLNADPTPDRAATSWRLSLAACLARTSVLADLGGPDPAFDGLTGAGLELGHRWITGGALCRHEPALLQDATGSLVLDAMGAADQQRFVLRRFGLRWAAYVALRSRPRRSGLRRLASMRRERGPTPAVLTRPPPAALDRMATVSVVIPTLDRYPWLCTVLAQLARQTVPPDEVLVVDQTEVGHREDIVASAPPDLPLRVLVRDVPGQCSARNHALAEVASDYVLFLDDDDEIPGDLIETHLRRLVDLGVDATCGVAVEPGEAGPTTGFDHLRVSDVFPTNNTLLRRSALVDTGLFDLAFDRGERADHDLGTRLYLAGHRLVLDPAASVLHHHAERGGLRAHAARVSTYRASRHSLVARHTLAPTEVYLWRRYFRPDQVAEALRLRLLGTLSRRGGPLARMARVVVQVAILPSTRRQLREATAGAARLARNHPTIPHLPRP